MALKPKIHAFCAAGCKWETVHKDDFDRSATYIPKLLTDGGADIALDGAYKIVSGARAAGIETLSRPVPTANTSKIPAALNGCALYVFDASYNSDTGERTASAYFRLISGNVFTPLPIPEDIAVFPGAVAVSVGQYVYIIGGYAHTALNYASRYDVISGEWETILTGVLPTGAYDIKAAVVGESIWLFGGVNDTGNLKTISVLGAEPGSVLNNLSTIDVTLPDDRNLLGVSAIDTKVYLFFDDGSVGVFDTGKYTLSYHEGTVNTGGSTCYASIGHEVYYFGGGNETDGYSNVIGKFDTVTGETTEYSGSAVLPVATNNITPIAYGNNVLLLGGDGVTAINKFSPESYLCEMRILASNAGNYGAYIPAPAYDRYRNYFYIEILHAQVIRDGNALFVVYEINGERHNLTIAGKNSSLERAKLYVRNAKELYLFNAEANVKSEIEGVYYTARLPVDGWTKDDSGYKIEKTLSGLKETDTIIPTAENDNVWADYGLAIEIEANKVIFSVNTVPTNEETVTLVVLNTVYGGEL